MKRPCDRCGKAYEAKRSTSKFCSSNCRSMMAQNGKTRSVAAIPDEDSHTLRPSQALVQTITAELTRVGRLDTVLGRQAVAVAQAIDDPINTGASVASLSRELRAVMEAALQGIGVADDPMNELEARRRAKLAAS